MADLEEIRMIKSRSGLQLGLQYVEAQAELTLRHNIPTNITSKRQISGDGNEDVENSRTTDTDDDNPGRAEVRVVGDLVENRKHLVHLW